MYLTAVMIVVIFLPIPIMMREIIKGTNPYRAVLEGVIAVGMATMMLFIFSMAAGDPVGPAMEAAGRKMADALAGSDYFTETLGIGQLTVSEQKEVLSLIYLKGAHSVPSLILIIASIAAYFEYMLISGIMKRSGKNVSQLPKFRNFTMPRGAIFGWFVILILSYIMNATSLIADNILLENVETLFFFIFAVQGLSTLFMFFYSKRLSAALAVAAAIFIFWTSIGQMVLFILGLMDLTFGLKARLLHN